MRQYRRLSFAAPVVLVVGALAGCPAPKKPEPIHDNPPAPQPTKRTVEECKAITPGTACEGDESCAIDTDCPTGFQCVDGTWQEAKVACNPPPPN
jgi:hypothetical protein